MLDTEQTLLEALKGSNGMTANEITELTDMPRGTVGSVTGRLVKSKQIIELTVENPNKTGRKTVKAWKLNSNPIATNMAAKTKKRSRRTATLSQIDQLQIIIHELTKWKEWAISIHPDLVADPKVVRARQLYAGKIPASELKTEVLLGKHDEHPAMQALIDLL